jgi:hypothetical protein
VPECVGFKVLPIPTKSLFREETLGEQQEPPRIHAGEVSVLGNHQVIHIDRDPIAC